MRDRNRSIPKNTADKPRQIFYRGRCSGPDIENFVCNFVGVLCRREVVGRRHIFHMAKVSRLLAIPENRDRLAGTGCIDELGDSPRVG